jgi:hypothetical protein
MGISLDWGRANPLHQQGIGHGYDCAPGSELVIYMPSVAAGLDHDHVAWPDVLLAPAVELGPGELSRPQEHLLFFVYGPHHRIVLVHVQRYEAHGLDGGRSHVHLQ